MKPISQQQARHLKCELEKLKARQAAQINRYRTDYPGGHNIATESMTPANLARLETAALLGFAIVAKIDAGDIRYYAVQP